MNSKMKVLILNIFVSFFAVARSDFFTDTNNNTSSSLIIGGPAFLDEPQIDGLLNMFLLVSKYGYPIQTHTVETADGYLLKVYRIPHGKKCKTADKNKKPVLLMHGLFCSSYDYVIMGPSKSLAYLLADECYDVWIGNNRGNSESRKHINMTTSHPKFFDFSWHEMGKYDVPAMVDYILNITNQPSLHYVGHSQGTTQFFVFNSLYPEYSSKIRTMHALAPVAFYNMPYNFAKFFKPLAKHLSALIQPYGYFDLLGISRFLNIIGIIFCRDQLIYSVASEICFNIPFLIGGFDPKETNRTVLPTIYGHFPAGASAKQFNHFSQASASGRFRQYDYGYSENLRRYGSPSPPDYNLNNVKAPVALYYSGNDFLSSLGDVKTLALKLPNVILKYRVPFFSFNHMDYLWAADVKFLVYEKVIEIMKQYF